MALRSPDERAFNRLLEALSRPYRRRLLVALLEHNPQRDDDPRPSAFADGGDPVDESDERLLEMYHAHLPNLEEFGYIAWNEDEGTISKGPSWAEIEPLLRLLHDHRGELPDGWL